MPIYRRILDRLLAGGGIHISAKSRLERLVGFVDRRFLYYQLYFSSLPFGEYLEMGIRTSHGLLKDFDLEQLSPEHSPAIKAILDGVLANGDFLLRE